MNTFALSVCFLVLLADVSDAVRDSSEMRAQVNAKDEMAKKDETIAALRAKLSTKETEMSELLAQVNAKDSAMTKKDETIAALRAKLSTEEQTSNSTALVPTDEQELPNRVQRPLISMVQLGLEGNPVLSLLGNIADLVGAADSRAGMAVMLIIPKAVTNAASRALDALGVMGVAAGAVSVAQSLEKLWGDEIEDCVRRVERFNLVINGGLLVAGIAGLVTGNNYIGGISGMFSESWAWLAGELEKWSCQKSAFPTPKTDNQKSLATEMEYSFRKKYKQSGLKQVKFNAVVEAKKLADKGKAAAAAHNKGTYDGISNGLKGDTYGWGQTDAAMHSSAHY